MLVDALLKSAEASPRKVAVSDGVRSLTYRQLVRLANVFRAVIDRLDNSGRVGVMLPASTAFPATLFGALWARRQVIPLNFLLSPSELAQVVEDAGIETILTVRHFAEQVGALGTRAVFLEDLALKRRMFVASLRGVPIAPRVQPNDTAVILYTSGTTAEPKGVELTYNNLYSNSVDSLHALGITGDHQFLNTLPPFHVFGLTGCVLVPALAGAAVFAMPRFSPVAAVRAVRERGITIMLAIPSMYRAILGTKSTRREDFANLTMAISGGEPLPDSVRAAFEERFGVTIREGYGLTETSPVLCMCTPGAYKVGTVGRPIPNVQLRIVGASGEALAVGEDGEIHVKSPGVMKGYYRKPDATRAVLDDNGWFATGDIGCVDGDGFLTITGRAKDMLIIGGENVFPREIEAALESYAGVMQAAVIGVPDDMRGEVPVAFVLPDQGQPLDEQTLRNHARATLAGYKVPRRVIIRDDLPRGPTGKILKRKLREML